jgi:hypothetical protein
MSEKKAVSRKVAFGIGLLCIALLIITSGVVANYTSALNNKNAQITNDQSQIGLLKSQNVNLQNQVSSDNSTLSSDNSTLSSDNSTLSSLKTDILSLQTQVASETSTVTQLQNQLSAYQSELLSENSEINSFNQTSVEDQISSGNSEINSLNKEVASLQSNVSSLETSLPSIDGFSVIQITDTQYLSDSAPSLFNGLTSWIVNSSGALNLVMVVHTGDIVQVSNSTGNWNNANNAMMKLYNNKIPYCWNAGNHDQFNSSHPAGGGDPNGSWFGGNYPAFNLTIMRQQPYWAGDINDGKDTAVKFSYNNYNFMVINIEYDANQTVLNWMQTLLKCNPNVNVIVATHSFLNGMGTYGWTANPTDVIWTTNFEKLLNNYTNVFMTLNGHDVNDGGTAYNKRVGNREEILFNRQEEDNQTGAATARIYAFNMSNPANPVVKVYTYALYLTPMQYLTDPLDQFSFSTNLTAYSSSTVSIAAGTTFLGASQNSVSFANSITLNGFSQNGTALTFNNVTLNRVTSNFTVTALGADIVISNFDLNNNITYTVDAIGSQTFSVKQPASVDITDSPASSWSYSPSNGEIMVTGATSKVVINFS